jgi:hypothetical protein
MDRIIGLTIFFCAEQWASAFSETVARVSNASRFAFLENTMSKVKIRPLSRGPDPKTETTNHWPIVGQRPRRRTACDCRARISCDWPHDTWRADVPQ